MANKKNALFNAHIQGAVSQKTLTEDEIKKKIVILEELRTFIPPLFGDELEQLAQNLIAEGCREPLVLWDDNGRFVLVDGHNRLQICQQHKIDFKIEKKNFENIDAVKDWMINNQIGKRNMTEEQKSYFRGLQYKREKKQGTRTDLTSGQNDQKSDTRQKLAEQHKVSPKTIQRDEKYADAIDKITQDNQELKWKILSRTIDVPKNLVVELADKNETEINLFKEQLLKGIIDKTTSKTADNSPQSEEKKKTEFSQTEQVIQTIELGLKKIKKGQEIETNLKVIKSAITELEKLVKKK